MAASITHDSQLDHLMAAAPKLRLMRINQTAIYCHNVALLVPMAEELDAVMAFSVRPGRQSPRPLDSLNFSAAQRDSQKNAGRNFNSLAAFLGIDPRSVVTCRQVHGDTVQIVESLPHTPVRADALIATAPGIFPAVKTADCLPILILDPVRKISAAVHAGWRGTILRITRKVLQILIAQFGSNPGDLQVALGPAIGSCCYEVDDRVLIPFRKAMPEADRFVRVVLKKECSDKRQTASPRLDLVGANRAELTSLGVPDENITSIDLCTSCHSELFFSYRRDGRPSGRHLAVTGFKSGTK